MDTQFLQNLGFTRSEIDVYLALLELGSTTTGPLVDKSGASSSKIYEILDRLIAKGMASYVLKGKVKHFEASPPNRILDYIAEQEQKLQEQRKQAQHALPQLELKHTLAKYKQEATIYRGMQGLRTAFYEALAEMPANSHYQVYGVPSRTNPVNSFFLQWGREREAKGVVQHILYNADARETAAIQDTAPLTVGKFLPPSVHMPASINVFEKSVIIFPTESQEEPLLIKIDDERIANSFRAQFNALWDQSVRTYKGLEGPRTIIREMIAAKEEMMIGLEGNKFYEHLLEETRELDRIQEKEKHNSRLIFRVNPQPRPIIGEGVQVRYLTEEYFSPLHVEIWGDSVGLIDWTEPITTIIIDRKEIALRYKKHFEQLWRIAKK